MKRRTFLCTMLIMLVPRCILPNSIAENLKLRQQALAAIKRFAEDDEYKHEAQKNHDPSSMDTHTYILQRAHENFRQGHYRRVIQDIPIGI